MNKCSDCKWWCGRSRKCDRIEMDESDGGRVKSAEDNAVIETFVHDDSGLQVCLRTGPNFGCTLFKPKPEKE